MTTREIWPLLRTPTTEALAARRNPDEPRMWLALDRQGQRHILVSLEGGQPARSLLQVRGLSAATATFALENGPESLWIDVHCQDPAYDSTFVTVGEDIAHALHGESNTIARVETVLREWQLFWGRGRGPSDEAMLGIFGELWFLDRWIPDPDPTTWLGPTGHRHDFTAAGISVEVKATAVRRDGSSRHRISHLDQLADPESGPLYLFSLQAVHDPNAGNSLPRMVQRLETRFASSAVRLETLRERLALVGWSRGVPDEGAPSYRITAEELYRVEGDFPRLTRASFDGGPPPGVDDIAYSLDLAACRPWRVATEPSQAAALLAGLSP